MMKKIKKKFFFRGVSNGWDKYTKYFILIFLFLRNKIAERGSSIMKKSYSKLSKAKKK